MPPSLSVFAAPYSKGNLPPILLKAGTLPAVHSKNGEKIRNGNVYIARADYHLILERGNKIGVN